MPVVLNLRHHPGPGASVFHVRRAGHQPLLPLWWLRGLRQCGVSGPEQGVKSLRSSLNAKLDSEEEPILQKRIHWIKKKKIRIRIV